MKNHFIFSYAGNKRDEVEDFYNKIDLKDISTIIEPYCGTAALSFYISTKHPKKYKYILNDIDENLINIYKIMKDENKIDETNKIINNLINEFNNKKTNEERKIYYNQIIKLNNIYSFIFTKKYYCIRHGLCPLFERTKQIKTFNIRDYPIYNFIKNEDITFFNKEALEIINEYRTNKENLIILDPPYISTYNDFYDKQYNMNIYEWLYNNNINSFKCSVYLILENIWINKLLFQNNKILNTYEKTYQVSKKKTEHILITKNNI